MPSHPSNNPPPLTQTTLAEQPPWRASQRERPSRGQPQPPPPWNPEEGRNPVEEQNFC